MLEDWDEWEEWERLARDWPALWSNCIKQKIRSVGTSSNSYGGLVMTYLAGENREVTGEEDWAETSPDSASKGTAWFLSSTGPPGRWTYGWSKALNVIF